MSILDDVEKFYDRVFGNNDGVFNFKDITKSAPAIVTIVVDIAMLVAEYRVYSVGLHLTGNILLALGFVMVSSVPFYLGELAFLYNLANIWQKIISVLMVLMGLGISGFFGFAELLTGTTVNAGVANINPVDPTTLYYIAIGGTIALILSGLAYGLTDDEIAQNLKAARIRARANASKHEMKIKAELLEELKNLRLQEGALKGQYSEDYDHLDRQFNKDKSKKVWNDGGGQRPSGNQNPQNRINNNRPSQNMQQRDMSRNNGNGSNHKSTIDSEDDSPRSPAEIIRLPMPTSQPKKSVFSEPQVRPFPSEKGLEESDKNPIELPHQEE
jgi:hypothetical protein